MYLSLLRRPPSSFLSIEVIVPSRGELAPSSLFEYTTLALFVEYPISHYCIRCACSAGRIRRIAGQYLCLILPFLHIQHLVTSSFNLSLPQTVNSLLDILVRLVPLLDRARTLPPLSIGLPLDTPEANVTLRNTT
jgi:hypothetical protein